MSYGRGAPQRLAERIEQLGCVYSYRLRHTFAQTASEQVDRDELGALVGQNDDRSSRFHFEVRRKRVRGAAKRIKMAVSVSA